MISLVASNYGEALFELAEESNKLTSMKSELLEIASVIRSNHELFDVLIHPKVSKENKKEIIKSVFKCDKLIGNFMMFLVDQGRFRLIQDIILEVVRKINEALNIEIAYVTSAVALSDDEKTMLKANLSKRVNKEVELECIVDESCLAGMRVQIADEVIDNTIMTKLENIKERVASVTLSN